MGGNKNKSKNQNENENAEYVKVKEQNIDSLEDGLHQNNEIFKSEAAKRPHTDDDSNSDSEKPKKAKKKKKRQLAPVEETSNKKGIKSIRQMKKEKHLQRQIDAQASAKDQLKSQCLNYLSQWKHDKQNWKFMKAKQVWLYKNKFSAQLVPNEVWPVFLEYFESAQGNIKKMLLDDAHKIINQMDQWTETQKEDKSGDNHEGNIEDETSEVNKPDEIIYNRARSLIQCLQE
ncbi:uncharacterized protein C7orf50 homolog [Melitaea cinxia]|uniref:uncharacterized protein C7orf50 homolog n=1 Tax=Melitaea cinxia TaxID=113334 RepID=UPI001E271286|nr:uncharacterized protein C7orf50 homolog [Melitaea cinxia]